MLIFRLAFELAMMGAVCGASESGLFREGEE
jgi:hypothetical protein